MTVEKCLHGDSILVDTVLSGDIVSLLETIFIKIIFNHQKHLNQKFENHAL